MSVTEPAARLSTASAFDDYLFDLRGYLLLEQAVTPEDVAGLNRALDDFPDLQLGEWHGNVQCFDNNGAAGVELQNIVEAGEPFERLIDHPSWFQLLRHFAGEENSGHRGLFIDECFASIRRSGGFFPIHSGGHEGTVRSQYRYVDGVLRCGEVNILLALTDVGPGDGAAMIVPGATSLTFPNPRRTTSRGTSSEWMSSSGPWRST